MGGRHIIAPNNPNFQKLLDNSKHWSFFHDTFNSEAFLMSTLRMVEQQCHLLDWNIELGKMVGAKTSYNLQVVPRDESTQEELETAWDKAQDNGWDLNRLLENGDPSKAE